MTRDEAISAFNGIDNPGSFGTPAWIDRFVALGMLKLEANSDWRFRLLKALQGTGLHLDINVLEVALDRASLQIVEKQNG